MAAANTLNICVSHRPFPPAFGHYVDLTIAPQPLSVASRLIVVPDEDFGPGGRALAEYGQLAWLADHFDEVCGGFEFIRLVQYRRFVSRVPLGRRSQVHFLYVRPDELGSAAAEFDRRCEIELVNSPVTFAEGGTLAQYAVWHVLDDLLSFAAYLQEAGLLTALETARFLEEPALVPAGSIGIFRAGTLRHLAASLRRAAAFVNSARFVAREGYQRRLGGFLLERLHSHLLLKLVRAGHAELATGHYIYISEDGDIRPTVG